MNISNKHSLYLALLISAMSVSAVFCLAYFIPRFIAINDVGVVVRSVGEQTEEVLLEDMRRIFGKENVYLIKNVTPESKSSVAVMELAQKIDKHWILCVDADVMFFENKLLAFLRKAKEIIKKEPMAFSFKGRLWDKIYQKDRYVGFQLYYKDNLKYSPQMGKECENAVRPDTCIRLKILQKGFDMVELSGIRLGVHAYYQYPEDDIKNGIMKFVYEPNSQLDLKSLWKNSEDCEYLLMGANIYDDLKKKNHVPKIPDNAVIKQIILQYDIKPVPAYQPKEIRKDMKGFNKNRLPKSFKRRVIHLDNSKV